MVFLRALLASLAAAIALAATAAHAHQPPQAAPPSPGSPAASRRTVAFFDFEERTPGPGGDFNPDPVPRHWFRAHDGPERDRPGFPAWNSAAFDDAVAASGSSSVRLDVAGGSASLRLMPGTIPVFPGADYAVTALIRTDGLDHARAFVTARFLDGSRRPIPAAEVRSEPVDSPGRWTRILFEMRGDHPEAAFLQLDLELLQPREFAAGSGGLGPHAVLFEDIDAHAWFDDVAVYQVPRVTLECQGPANIVLAPDRPQLRFSIRDMVGDALRAALVVEDDRGQRVAATTAEGDATGRTSLWTPDLPSYGWYRASLLVSHDGHEIARASTQFLYLPPVPHDRPIDYAPPAELRRWGLVADAAPPPGVPAWPAIAADVARAVGTGFFVLPHADATLAPADLARSLPEAEPALEALLALRQDVTLCFAAVPARLAADLRIDATDTSALSSRDPANWLPYLSPVLERTAQRVFRWQIGPVAAARTGTADLAAAVAGYRSALSGHVPGLRLGAALRPGARGLTSPDSVSAIGADDLLVCFPTGPAPGAVAATLAAAAKVSGPEVTVVFGAALSGADLRTDSSLRESLDDLVRAAAEFVAAPRPAGDAPPPRAAIAAPWVWTDATTGWTAGQDATQPLTRAQAVPQPHLAVWRTLMDHLAGRTVVAELPVRSPDGRGRARCIVLGDPDSEAAASRPLRGAILAWSNTSDGDPPVLSAYLGEGPLTIVDIFGNESPLPMPEETGVADGHVEIPIPRSPIFIEGIDPRIVRFIASLRIDPAFARAIVAEHEHALVLDNPWPIRVSGQLQIVSPNPDAPEFAGWTINPRGPIPFSIAPHATERIPISFSFGAAEESGRKQFQVVVRLVADRPYPPQVLTAPLDIGSEDLTLVCEAVRSPDPNGPDVVVTATITNRGRRLRSMSLDAVAPGLPSQQFPIGDLAPGQTTIRRFVFRGAAKALAGRRIRLSLTDTDVSERLNTSVVAPE